MQAGRARCRDFKTIAIDIIESTPENVYRVSRLLVPRAVSIFHG